MRIKNVIPLLFAFALFGIPQKTQAQIREIPETVKEAFQQQYPQAQKVQFEDKLIFVLVHFLPGDQRTFSDSLHTAKYSSKGVWQLTDTPMPFAQLPDAVKDGFHKSKYAKWQLDHVYQVKLPGGQLRYKLQTEKSVFQKRNLYYSGKGRLISDNITLY